MKVSILGASGGIGQPLSLLLANQLPAGSQLALYDIAPLMKGIGVDLSHIATDVNVKAYVGAEITEALQGADVVLVLAGIARKPGMTRSDLIAVNAGIVQGLIEHVADTCPKALIGIVSNPVNALVPVAAEILQAKGVYNHTRLFGVNALDIMRTKTLVGHLFDQSPHDIHPIVIGGHSTPTILPLLSHIPGLNWTQEQVESVTKRIREAGNEVVMAKEGHGSATLSMAQAAAEFTLSLVKALSGDEQSLCAYVPSPDMDIPFFARPLVVGKEGICRYLNYDPLSTWEQSQLSRIIAILRSEISEGYDAVAHAAN